MEKQITHKLLFSQSAEEVWQYLTDADLMGLWLMKNDFKPIVGHEFRFTTKPLPQFDFDGIAYCKVLELVPYKKLVYSWKGGPAEGQTNLDSVVEWTLTPNENGTELLLVHRGFKETGNVLMYAAMNEGWLKNMKKIQDYLNEKDNGTNKS